MISSISIMGQDATQESERTPIMWEEADYVRLQVTILDFLLFKSFQFFMEDIGMLIKFLDKIGWKNYDALRTQ